MKKGAYTLIVTPFKKDFSLDEEALRRLVRRQVEAGIHGIAPLGVTGEITLMDDDEIYRVVEIIVEEAGGKTLVMPEIPKAKYKLGAIIFPVCPVCSA